MTMDVATAQEEFLRKVYAPKFVEKLAALGVPVNSEQELHALMETAAMLKAAKLYVGEQPANSPVVQARDLLKQAMFGDAQAQEEAASDGGLLEATAALLASAQQGQEQTPEREPAEQNA